MIKIKKNAILPSQHGVSKVKKYLLKKYLLKKYLLKKNTYLTALR